MMSLMAALLDNFFLFWESLMAVLMMNLSTTSQIRSASLFAQWACWVCCLWPERNARKFEWCEWTILDMKLQVFKNLVSGVKSYLIFKLIWFYRAVSCLTLLLWSASTICSLHLVHSNIYICMRCWFPFLFVLFFFFLDLQGIYLNVGSLKEKIPGGRPPTLPYCLRKYPGEGKNLKANRPSCFSKGLQLLPIPDFPKHYRQY